MRFTGHIAQSPAIVPEELDRHPLAHGDEIEFPVAIEIEPLRVGNHPAWLDQLGRDLACHVGEMAAVVTKDVASGRIRILHRRQATTNKKIRAAIAVEIPYPNGGGARQHRWETRGVPRKPAATTIDVETVLQQCRVGWVLVTATGDIKVG